jgi:hypothetical protein
MSKAKGGSRGRISASKQSLAPEANGAGRLASNEQGDLGEVAFLHKAMSLGFAAAKPYGQNHRYDFIVDGGKNLWRVQVKTCTSVQDDLYKVGIHRSLNGVPVPYTESELDFVVVYIMPKGTWYVLPVREVVGQTYLRFRGPSAIHIRDPYAYYREAWHLLREPDGLTFG